MKQFAFLTNGVMAIQAKSILRLIQERLSFWWRNTALEAIRAAYNYNYWFAAGIVMYALKRRWQDLLDRMPARRRLRELEQDYWHMYDEWTKLDYEYRLLYAKHMDLHDEVRYWEMRHAKVLNYIERQMENTELGGLNG